MKACCILQRFHSQAMNKEKSQLKRAGSDSGISNDSMDVQVAEKPVPAVSVPLLQITVNRDKTRAVNGRALNATALPPVVADCDLDHELDDGAYEEIDDGAQEDSEDDVCSPNWSPDNSDSCSSISTENSDESDAYWEHEDIDVSVLTSKCSVFEDPVLETEEITEKFLLALPKNTSTLTQTWGHIMKSSSSLKPQDDDLISLHPSESLDHYILQAPEPVPLPQLATKPKKAYTKLKHMPMTALALPPPTATPPTQPASQPQSQEHPSYKVDTNQNLLARQPPAPPPKAATPNLEGSSIKRLRLSTEVAPVPPPSNWKPSPPSTVKTIPKPPSQNMHSIQADVFKVPVPSVKNINPVIPPPKPPSQLNPSVPSVNNINTAIPPPKIIPRLAEVSTENIFTLSKKICSYYDGCNKFKCHRIHQLTSQMMAGSVIGQQFFWKQLMLKSPISINAIKSIYEQFPPALIKTSNRELLLMMLTDALSFDVWHRDTFIKQCVDGLLQIKVNDALPRYDEVIESVLRWNDCNPEANVGEVAQVKITLCDILLCLTVDQPDFFVYWPVIEKIFNLLSQSKGHQLDYSVVSKIMKECLNDAVSPCFTAEVFNKLVRTDLVNKEKLSMEHLIAITMKMQTATNNARSPATGSETQLSVPAQEVMPVPSPAKPILEAELRALFLEQGDADMLGEFYRRHCNPQNWRLIATSITNMLDEFNNETDINRGIDIIKESVFSCLIDQVEGDLQMFLMTLVFHMVIFQKRMRFKNYTYWDVCAVLIGVFEDTIELFHTVPVYFEDFKNEKSWYIFAYLIHGKKHALAMRWVSTPEYRFPAAGAETYKSFCRLTKELFRGLYNTGCLEECKDMILLLEKSGFDLDGLQQIGDFNVYEYYRKFVCHMMYAWWKEGRDIVKDAEESIFHFHTHLTTPEIRNILILLYLRWKETDFVHFVEMVDACEEFDQANNEQIFYNANLSVVEIQFVTHVFFYKMLKRNQRPCNVNISYGELAGDQKITSPHVSLNSFWDSEAPIKRRVNFALSKFALRPIPKLTGVIGMNDVKLILEQIRRKSSAL